MANFPEDVIIDILIRLPSKCLCRFRCVSRHWNALLTGPSFIKAHLHRSLQLRSHLLLRYDDNSVSKLGVRYSGHRQFSDLDLPTGLNDFSRLSLVDSFNGIVCMSTNLHNQRTATIIMLWNPAIKDCITLPEPQSPKPKYAVVGFGFNPFDGHLDDFKVIAINVYREPWEDPQQKISLRVYLYSFRKNSWKELGDYSPSWHPNNMGNQVILNEFICWCPWTRMNDRLHMAIVSFDVVNEEFSEMALPDSIPTFSYNYITLLDGCVSLLATDPSKGYEVWTMKEFGTVESWTKLYNIDLLTGGSKHYEPLGFASVNEALLVSSRFLGLRFRSPTYIFSYDMEKRMHGEDLNLNIDLSCITRIAIYVESMISLHNTSRLKSR